MSDDNEFYRFKGKITLELEIDSDENGMTPKSKVTVTGINKDQLYWLFEGCDFQEDLGMYVYEHMDRMPETPTDS